MSDPITTVVTVISEHPQAAAAVASIYGVVKPFLAKILGPAADEVGEIGRDYIKGFRAKNIEDRLTGADKLLGEAGIEPQPVPPKVLVPLLEAASLEDNPLLSEQWECLLANAANPYARAKIDGNLVDILKQINYNQAIMLTVISAMLGKGDASRSYQQMVGFTLSAELVRDNLRIIHEAKPDIVSAVSEEDFYISLDNLARLRLCTLTGVSESESSPPASGSANLPQALEALFNLHMYQMPGRANISITYLGLAFLDACEAPVRPELPEVTPAAE
ncbi:MAG: Abi-alpha family protein [Janthinobacterium lividum]